MNDADDHQRIGPSEIVDGVRAVKRNPQARRQLVACRTGKREVPQLLKMRLDRRDKPRRDRFRRFLRQVCPYLGEVGLGRFGDAKG